MKDKNQLEFISVKGGVFTMGSPKIPGHKLTPHEVEVSSFKISKYMITMKQYLSFLHEYQSDVVKEGVDEGQRLLKKQKGLKKNVSSWETKEGFDNFPIAVTWYGAIEYCKHYGYRLPTEAEWEFAAKGGLLSKGFVYSGSDALELVAWTKDSSFLKSNFPVGEKDPNELGIYDMTGLMMEWCNDWYDKNYYSISPQKNPTGPESGKLKVKRGGSAKSISHKAFYFVSGRGFAYPDLFDEYEGFRPVLDVKETQIIEKVEKEKNEPRQEAIVEPPKKVENKYKDTSSNNGLQLIIVGILLSVGGGIASAASEGQVVFYGAIAVGIGMVIAGIIRKVNS